MCKHFGILSGEYQALFETYVTYGVNIDHGSIEGSTTWKVTVVTNLSSLRNVKTFGSESSTLGMYLKPNKFSETST